MDPELDLQNNRSSFGSSPVWFGTVPIRSRVNVAYGSLRFHEIANYRGIADNSAQLSSAIG